MIEDIVGGLVVPFFIVLLVGGGLRKLQEHFGRLNAGLISLPIAYFIGHWALLGRATFPPHNAQESLIYIIGAGAVWSIGAQALKQYSLAAFLGFRAGIGLFLALSFWSVLRPIAEGQGIPALSYYFAVALAGLCTVWFVYSQVSERVHPRWVLAHFLLVMTGWALVFLMSGSASMANLIGLFNAILFAWFILYFRDKDGAIKAWISLSALYFAAMLVISLYYVDIPWSTLSWIVGAQLSAVLFFIPSGKKPWLVLVLTAAMCLGLLATAVMASYKPVAY